MKNSIQWLVIVFAIYLPGLHADGYRLSAVEALIAADSEPEGVVFEIITWEDNSWEWAAPMLQTATRQLRDRYPGIDIVLISHGNELFDLALKNNHPLKPAMQILQSLSEEQVDFYVSGDYAKYKKLGTKDFLAFVDVSPSGATQLQDFINLGFSHIVLERPNAVN